MSAEHRRPVMAFVALALVAALVVVFQRADASSGVLLAASAQPELRVTGSIPTAEPAPADADTYLWQTFRAVTEPSHSGDDERAATTTVRRSTPSTSTTRAARTTREEVGERADRSADEPRRTVRRQVRRREAPATAGDRVPSLPAPARELPVPSSPRPPQSVAPVRPAPPAHGASRTSGSVAPHGKAKSHGKAGSHGRAGERPGRQRARGAAHDRGPRKQGRSGAPGQHRRPPRR